MRCSSFVGYGMLLLSRIPRLHPVRKAQYANRLKRLSLDLTLPQRVTNEVVEFDAALDAEGLSEDDLKIYAECVSFRADMQPLCGGVNSHTWSPSWRVVVWITRPSVQPASLGWI